MVVIRLKADGTNESATVNMTEQEQLAMFGPMPTTLQEKIEAIGNFPELNEIMAELIDLPTDDEESEEE